MSRTVRRRARCAGRSPCPGRGRSTGRRRAARSAPTPRARGASTVRTFGSASVRERYGWAASTRSYSNSWAAPMFRGMTSCSANERSARYSTSTDGVAYTGLPLFELVGLPALFEDVLEARDLLVVVEGVVALQRDVPPLDLRLVGRRPRVQARRLGVEHVGQHHDRVGMLGETVGEAGQREARVLHADLLADDDERHRRQPAMEIAEDVAEHHAVAGSGVEHAQRRGCRLELGELASDARRDLGLLARRRHEQQVLLAVVVEPERFGRRRVRRRVLHGRSRGVEVVLIVSPLSAPWLAVLEPYAPVTCNDRDRRSSAVNVVDPGLRAATAAAYA